MKKKLLCILLGISMIGTMSGCASKSSKKEETVPKEESILPDKYEKQHREVREPVYRTAATSFAGGDGSEVKTLHMRSVQQKSCSICPICFPIKMTGQVNIGRKIIF